ncbi:MAG: ImmA/IrrE family metallo-endopeptidase, partial [Arcobacteraceae bacterium]
MKKKYLQFLGKSTDAYKLLHFLEETSDFKLGIPIDVRKILDYLELKYSVKPNFKQIKLDGKISIEDDEPLIWSNPMKITIEERKRFTLAHELGHFFLHIAPGNNLSKDIVFEDSSISFNRDDN